MTNALAQMELTGAQGMIIGYLCFHQIPPCPRDLEEAFHLTHPTVSGLLQRLEKKGFIEILPDQQDRRCKRIYVLDKGRQVHSAMHQTIMGIETQLTQGFTEEEKAQFSAYLSRAIENMGVYPCKRKPKEEPEKHD